MFWQIIMRPEKPDVLPQPAKTAATLPQNKRPAWQGWLLVSALCAPGIAAGYWLGWRVAERECTLATPATSILSNSLVRYSGLHTEPLPLINTEDCGQFGNGGITPRKLFVDAQLLQQQAAELAGQRVVIRYTGSRWFNYRSTDVVSLELAPQ